MATPIGHALAGLAVSSLFYQPHEPAEATSLQKRSIGSMFLQFLYRKGAITLISIFMAVAPDLDLIPGFLQGQPVLYHGGVSHSLGIGLLLSLLVSALWRIANVRVENRWFALNASTQSVFVVSFWAFCTHLFLDMLGPDGREPFGIPVLWPFSSATFLSPAPLLLGVRHASQTTAGIAEFLSGVLSIHNIVAILWECVLIVPFILLGIWRNRQHRGENGVSPFPG